MGNQFKILCAVVGLFFINLAFAVDNSVVKVGVFNNKPIVFQEQESYPSGLAIDVLEDIADKENWQIEYVHGSWGDVYSKLEQNKIDILVGIAYSKERAKNFHYTKQTLVSNWGMVSRRPGVDISAIPDLQNKRIALMKGSIHSKVFMRLLEQFNIPYQKIAVKDYHEVMRAVEDGRADAGVINRLFSIKNASDYDLVGTSIMFNPVEVKYASSKKRNSNLLQVIDSHLAIQKKDKQSTYHQLIARWLTSSKNQQFPVWLTGAIALIIGALLIVFAFNVFLQRQVAIRTAALADKAKELEQENAERSKIEAALRDSESHFKSLVETASAIPWELDIKTEQFTYVGPQATKLLGYPIEQWYEKGFWESHIHEEDREDAVNYCLAKTEGLVNHDFEYRMYTASEEIIWVRDYVNVVSDTEGLIGLKGFMFDITAAKQAELELFRHREELEELVKERTEALSKAKNDADVASRAKSEFLSRMSHELRTPLNVIMGYSNIAGRLSDNEDVNKHLKEINVASNHLFELIKDVMDLSRIETDDLQINITKVNLREVIEESEKFLDKDATKNKITMSLFDCQDDVYVLADGLRLKEVIINLLSNAIKYNHKNGKVDIQCHYIDSDNLRIEVIDTGKGLDEEQIKHLFEPFSRLGAEYTDVEGTGVGLVIAKSLVERMNGTLAVSSTVRKGSCFAITIPLFKESDN